MEDLGTARGPRHTPDRGWAQKPPLPQRKKKGQGKGGPRAVAEGIRAVGLPAEGQQGPALEVEKSEDGPHLILSCLVAFSFQG